jgi:hypothetical protein
VTRGSSDTGPGISIGRDVHGNAFIGDHNRLGDVTTGGPSPDREEVLDLVAALRAEIAAKDPGTPGRESALDTVDELADQVRAEEPSGEVVRHLVGGLARRLVGALAVGTSVAVLAERIAAVIGG